MIKSMVGITFDCKNAKELSNFYEKLTGWEKEVENDNFSALRTPEGILMVFQSVENYLPPVWPWEDDRAQQMVHIDYLVENLEEGVKHAQQCGAKKAEVQYYEAEGAIVMFDPAGHPFCLTVVDE